MSYGAVCCICEWSVVNVVLQFFEGAAAHERTSRGIKKTLQEWGRVDSSRLEEGLRAGAYRAGVFVEEEAPASPTQPPKPTSF